MGERIVMLGAGAVGGYVGGHLALHGQDVTLIDFWHENIEAGPLPEVDRIFLSDQDQGGLDSGKKPPSKLRQHTQYIAADLLVPGAESNHRRLDAQPVDR
jgi:hypothetical protein